MSLSDVVELKVKMSDPAMRRYAFDTAIGAVNKHDGAEPAVYEKIVRDIVDAFNARYGGPWQCIVDNGEMYSLVRHVTGLYARFSLGGSGSCRTKITLFKSSL